MRLIDCHAHGNRWARRHPAEKMVLAAGSLLTSLMLPLLPAACLFAGMMALTLAGARVPWRIWFGFMVAPAGFVLVGAATLMLRVGEGPDGAWFIGFDPAAWPAALGVVMRSMAAMASLVFLLMTTPVTDVMQVLRRMGCPESLVALMAVTYRSIFLLMERMSVMIMAQQSRLGYINRRAHMRSAGYLAAGLLGASLRHSRRLKMGWASRGYDGLTMPFAPVYQPVSWRRCYVAATAWSLLIIAGHHV